MTATEISMRMTIIIMITDIMRDILIPTDIIMKITTETEILYEKGIDNGGKFGYRQGYCKITFQQGLAGGTCCKACRQADGT